MANPLEIEITIKQGPDVRTLHNRWTSGMLDALGKEGRAALDICIAGHQVFKYEDQLDG